MTVVMISFSNFKHACFGSSSGKKSGDDSTNRRSKPRISSSNQAEAYSKSSLNTDTTQISQDTSERYKIRNQNSNEDCKKKENIPPE